jgi:hypothetical protein
LFVPDSHGLQLQQKNTKAKYVPDNIFSGIATLRAYLWRDKTGAAYAISHRPPVKSEKKDH